MKKNVLLEDRLNALKKYRIDESLSSDMLDLITSLASSMTNFPIALISVLDDHRQFFPSKIGIEVTETPIEWSFCKYAIQSPDDFYSVLDAKTHPSFKDNPLVKEPLNIMCYHGATLITPENVPIGTICVIHNQESFDLSENQKQSLKYLARIIITHFCYKRDMFIMKDKLIQFRKSLMS